MIEKVVEWLIAGTGAIAVLFIALYLKSLAEDSRDNAKSISAISANVARVHNEVIANFVTKPEFNGVREKVEDLRADVTELQVKTGLPVRR